MVDSKYFCFIWCQTDSRDSENGLKLINILKIRSGDSLFPLQNYSDNSECLEILAAVSELPWDYREANWEEYLFFCFKQDLEGLIEIPEFYSTSSTMQLYVQPISESKLTSLRVTASRQGLQRNRRSDKRFFVWFSLANPGMKGQDVSSVVLHDEPLRPRTVWIS